MLRISKFWGICIVQAGLELLPQPPECRDQRHAPPRPAEWTFFKALTMFEILELFRFLVWGFSVFIQLSSKLNVEFVF